MKKWSYSLICGIALILVTVVLYFVILSNLFAQLMNFLTLCGVVTAEIIAVVLAVVSKGEPRRLGAVILFALMIPYAVILSVVYITNFPDGYLSYIAWYFVGLLVVACLSVVLLAFGTKRQTEHMVLQTAKDNMLEMRKITKMIAATENGRNYIKELSALEEQMHYSNSSIIAPQDAAIKDRLLNLQNNIVNPEYDAAAEIAQIAELVTVRNIAVNQQIK